MMRLLLFVIFWWSSGAVDITNEDNLSIGDIKRLSLSTDTIHSFSVKSNNDSAGFILQLHSQYHVIKLSKSHDFTYDETTEGTNIGLWQAAGTQSNFTQHTFYANVSCTACGIIDVPVVLVAVTAVEYDAPLPGGCTLVSPLATEPNIQLTFTTYTTTVTFQDSNLGPSNVTAVPPLCVGGDSSHFAVTQIQYTIFRKLLPPEDYTSETFFSTLENVLKKDLKDDNGLPNVNMNPLGVKTLTFDSFSGDGAVYIVMATSLINGKSSAYVPSVTYSCTLSPTTGVCDNMELSAINIIASIIMGLMGLYLCFLSHRFFHFEVVIFSWVTFSFAFYILDNALLEATHTVRVSLALSLGLVLSLILFMIWFFTGWYLPFVFLFNASSGFLIGTTTLYTPFGSLFLWRIGYVYGLLVGCFVVFFLIPAVVFPRATNILSSSLVGGYLIIFAIGNFVFTTLDQIVLKVVKIASISDYLKYQQVYPFQLNDILLASAWGVFLLLGVFVQALLARKREHPFPQPSLYKQLKRKLEQEDTQSEERRKLLDTYCSSPTTSIADYGSVN